MRGEEGEYYFLENAIEFYSLYIYSILVNNSASSCSYLMLDSHLPMRFTGSFLEQKNAASIHITKKEGRKNEFWNLPQKNNFIIIRLLQS